MNHIYRIVWNQTKACWQAVCETANGHPRGTSSRRASGTSRNAASVRPRTQLKLSHATLLCGFGLMTATVGAAPTGGQVSAGTATISQSGATTTIQQASQKAAIDWTGFSVGKTESVRFNQPNASAITLNRVTGTERSEILGSLSANGQVFILNPNGVLFGKGAQVNVGGIVASTLRMSNEDFMAGNFRLTEGPNARASVSNEGEIRVAEGGVLALIAPVVTNTGTLAAPQGSVLMAAADAVSVTLQDGSLVSYTLDKGNLQALVDNGGVIHAEGGHVVLTAKGLDALSKAVVNHSGIIEAQTVATKNGVVELLGDMELGQVNLSGRVDASAPKGGDGGSVETSAAKVSLTDDAHITTVSALGKVGKWLLDPTDLTIAPSGGDLTGRVISDQLARNDVVLQSTQGASNGNGDIFVKDRISWTSGTSLSLLAGRNILINAEINASGSGAGVALNTGLFGGGQYVLGAGGRITLSGASPEFAINGENYKVIQTVAQLQAMNDNLLGRYILGTDINASATSNWNGGKGFLPIGQGASNFMGVLDGLGHQVNGLYINRPSESEVGLIGSMEATVRNIGVSGANITGLDSVGALAGQLRWGSSVSQSFASGKVTGRGNVGGLIGFATPYHYGVPYWCSQCIAIDQSYADVAVAGQGGVGGLVGTIDQTSITNSYAVGNVSSPEIVGGLVGHNWSSYIVNSYSSGQVQGQASGVGGLVGLRNGNVINSHYDSQTSGLPGGNTTAEMKQQATFSGWDFNGVWRIVEGSSYPILRALTKDKITLTVSAANETKVYNAEPWNPDPSNYISYAGFAVGDNSGSLSGVLRLEGAAIGAIDVGRYGYSGAGLSSQKYEISYLPGYLTITPSPISVSGARPYDASNKAYAESVTSLNGVFGRDKGLVSVTAGSGVLSGVNVGEWALSSLDTLTLGGQAAGNYRLVASESKWAISPRPLIIVPFDATKTYGDPDPKLSYVIAGGGLLGNDILAGELGRAPGENAGSYAINKGSLVAGSNYSIQINEPLSHLLINQRPLSLIGERKFDGTNKAYASDVIRLSGFVGEEDRKSIVLVAGGYGDLDAPTIGKRSVTSVSGFAIVGVGAENYFITTNGSVWNVINSFVVDCSLTGTCSQMGEKYPYNSNIGESIPYVDDFSKNAYSYSSERVGGGDEIGVSHYYHGKRFNLFWPMTEVSVNEGRFVFVNYKPVAVTATLYNREKKEVTSFVIPPAIGVGPISAVSDFIDAPISNFGGLLSSAKTLGGRVSEVNIPPEIDIRGMEVSYTVSDRRSMVSSCIGVVMGGIDIVSSIAEILNPSDVGVSDFRSYVEEIALDALGDPLLGTSISSVIMSEMNSFEKANAVLKEINAFLVGKVEERLLRLGAAYYEDGLPKAFVEKVNSISILKKAVNGYSSAEKASEMINAINWMYAFKNPTIVETDLIGFK